MSLYSVAQFPSCRPRRLRQSAPLRRMVRETQLSAHGLVLPLFVRSGRKVRRAIDAMPGIFQLSPDEMLKEATRAFEAGVPAVLLFGIPDRKDAKASGAYAPKGIVQEAVRLLKKEVPEILVITDVCLCEYMIAANDFKRAIHDSLKDGFAIAGRAQRGIHFEIRVICGPGGTLRVTTGNFFSICPPEFFAASYGDISQREMMRARLA